MSTTELAPTRTWPSIDVVIATRNRPELVREAVAAVWAQRYAGHVRCLVVFDQCEPDPTLSRRRADRSVEVISNDRSPGLAGARNAGILAGSADLVGFCDDDDVWYPDKLRHQVTAMTADDAATCVTGIEISYHNRLVVRVPDAADMTVRSLVRSRVMEAHPSTVLVRRDALLTSIGLVDEDIPGSYGEDFDWIIRAAGSGPISVVPEPMVRVRWGGSQFSTQWRTIVDAIDYGLAKHPAFHEDRRALGRLYGRRAFARAALGESGAFRDALRTVGVWPWEKRAYLAGAVALRVVSAERLLDLAHRRGHGI